ncbi:hypothetical protein FS837_000244 [Tulasnella sp. UAMH 9824]|nr:hypothetical protein FS837_000244 [Tulasnella sp. UAMH 9824]
MRGSLISLVSPGQYPYRPVQIVLRIYQSPAEILAGFDVDCACVAFDGTRVLAAPRAILALMTQCNRVAMDRRSPSYEVRLAKYATRGFEIHVPDLRREDFDPTIFERALTRVAGLARLLVLEKLSTQAARDGYISQRRQTRARPDAFGSILYSRKSRRERRRDKRLRGDLKTAAEFGGLQMSEYDVMFHIPYGPGIDAKSISDIVYQTDLGLNSTFNPRNKDRRLHRHPAFFGNMRQALGDCCKHCPLPETDEEKEKFEKEQEQFVTGRVSFIQDDPGRQMSNIQVLGITGSFRPIDSGEWSEQAYLKPTAKLFSYIAAHNRAACNDFLKRNAEAINTRDHLGRTPLQFALLCSAEDICLDLIAQGGRMTARMVDGRCSLHLSAQMGLPKVLKALLEKSEKNKAESEAKQKEAKDNEGKDKDVKMKDRDDEARLFACVAEIVANKGHPQIRDSSEDDWSSEDDVDKDYEEAKKKVDPKGDPVKSEEDPLEDSEDQPDILDIDAPDWDQSLTALGYAIINGSLPSVQILIAAGADCKIPRNLSDTYQGTPTFYPLTLTALTPDESVGAQIAEQLITVGGASCAAADSATVTVFHRLVSLNKPQIIETILKVDPTANAASRFLYSPSWQYALHPIVSAFAAGQRAMVAVLLAYGNTRAFVDLETYDRSVAANPNQSRPSYLQAGEQQWKTNTLQPLEASLADYNDLYRLVLALEPESVKNFVPRCVHQCHVHTPGLRRAMLDFLRSALREAKRPIEELEKAGAQTWDAIYLEMPSQWKVQYGGLDRDPDDPTPPTPTMMPRLPINQPFNPISAFQMMLPTINPSFNPVPHFQSGMSLSPFGLGGPAAFPFGPTPVPFGQTMGPAPPQIDEKMKPFKRYLLFKPGYGTDYPGTHLIPLYDELYEACWNGDNDKIRALCLPPNEETLTLQSGTRDLLQITAKVIFTQEAFDFNKGYTPLYVALRARKWDTARLILEIAQKQLMKEEDDVVNDNDDEDDSDGDSCASDQTETRPFGYTNLVTRFHTVSVNVKPNQLFSQDALRVVESTSSPNGSVKYADPISLAVFEKDVEAFHQIADMMERLEEPMSIPVHLLQTILATDSPEMLDAFIRRTGEGLSLPKPKGEESADGTDPVQHHDGEDNGRKIYLGLDVDDKKRTDLARRQDPNAPSAYAGTGNQIPIAWYAASKQATAILEYLNSSRAIEAYKYYAETKKTILAKRLTEALTNTENFSRMVGYSVSQYAETPVLATIWNPAKPDKILPTLKKLMELQPRLTADGVRLQAKPGRMSPILFLCQTKAPVEVFDWLMANGADPLVRDERGWNILHILFDTYNINWELIEHVLTKLPADVTRAMMAQQCRTRRSTPFAVVVNKANLRLVELLLRTVKDAVVPTLLLRDSTGATPLHSAILQGNSKIVAHLISIGPPEMLYLENGVGSTPMEITRLQFLTQTLRGLVSPLPQPNGLNTSGVDLLQLITESGMRDRDEKEVKSLRRVIDDLKSSGALARKPELFKVLSDFADRSEHEFAIWVAQKPKDKALSAESITNNENDGCDVKATFDQFSKAVVEVHQRQLVSLRDVQLTVLTAVESSNGTLAHVQARRAEVSEAAEPDETQDLGYSSILGAAGTYSAAPYPFIYPGAAQPFGIFH